MVKILFDDLAIFCFSKDCSQSNRHNAFLKLLLTSKYWLRHSTLSIVEKITATNESTRRSRPPRPRTRGRTARRRRRPIRSSKRRIMQKTTLRNDAEKPHCVMTPKTALRIITKENNIAYNNVKNHIAYNNAEKPHCVMTPKTALRIITKENSIV